MAKKFRKLNASLNEFNIQDLWTKSIVWPLFAQTKTKLENEIILSD